MAVRRCRNGCLGYGASTYVACNEFCSCKPLAVPLLPALNETNTGALIIRIGCRGNVYYNHTIKEPQNSVGNYLGPYIRQN